MTLNSTEHTQGYYDERNSSSQIKILGDLQAFTEAVGESGVTLDFSSLVSLNANFLDSTSERLILSLKFFDADCVDNIVFVHKQEAILYSKCPPAPQAMEAYSAISTKPYGRNTALTFLVLKAAVANYRMRLETLIKKMESLEAKFETASYHVLALDFARLYDRAEDLLGILIELNETNIREVDPRLISFDYRILTAEADNLVNRCRNRFNIISEFSRENELRETKELNLRIEQLNNVMKKLTAITLVLMIPTLIASHFGMNFKNMPELNLAWAYPAVVVSQIMLIIMAVLLFRKVRWL